MAITHALRCFERSLYAVVVLFSLICTPLVAADEWHTVYDGGFKPSNINGSVSKFTSSKGTPEGLRIADASTEKGSIRCYTVGWNAQPQQGATVEVRLKCISCSGTAGVALGIRDGVHGESLTFYPDRIELDNSKLSAAFDCAGDFHTYKVHIQGTDITLYADGKQLIRGKGKFSKPIAGDKVKNFGFGAGSSLATSEAIWQRIRFSDGTSSSNVALTPPSIPGLKVEVGATQVIIPNGKYVGMFKLADGDVVVGGKRSSDGGKTWRPSKSLSNGAYQFSDGEIVELAPTTILKPTDRDGVFKVSIRRSSDNGRTIRVETALMTIPEGTGGTNDDGTPSTGPAADHAIVQLRDGSLMAAMYGHFKTDTVLCPAFPAKWKMTKTRVFVVRSTDRGKTWDYLTTVASDPTLGQEGFGEPDLLTLPDGDILCFMRTGGSSGGYTPLFLSRSANDGRTWSKPVPIADRGVWPNACLMKNGVIACTYGRPDNWLVFSLDQGKTWAGHFCFHRYRPGTATSYNSIEEVEPGTLLVIYDCHSVDDDGNPAFSVKGTRFTVKRDNSHAAAFQGHVLSSTH